MPVGRWRLHQRRGRGARPAHVQRCRACCRHSRCLNFRSRRARVRPGSRRGAAQRGCPGAQNDYYRDARNHLRLIEDPAAGFASSYASRGSVLTRLRLRSAFDPSGCAKCTDAGAVFGAATRPRPRVAPGQPVPTATGRSVGAAQPPRVLRPAARGLWTPHLDLTGQSAQTLDQPAGTPTKGPRAVFQPPI
jgi:hypothetical protein